MKANLVAIKDCVVKAKTWNPVVEAKDENIFGYLIKPFQISDVEATLSVAISSINRIKKLQEQKKDEEINIKEINLGEKYIYCFDSKTLTFKNYVVSLTKKELEVFHILCKNINKNISYEYLKDIVWINKDISDSTVQNVVSRLKKKLDNINIENRLCIKKSRKFCIYLLNLSNLIIKNLNYKFLRLFFQ